MREKQVFRQLLDWGKGSICQECIYTEACKNAHEACVACNRFSGKDGCRNEVRDMTVKHCDICRRPIKEHNTTKVSGALAEISGAEEVCQMCAAQAARIDWREVVREAWRDAP